MSKKTKRIRNAAVGLVGAGLAVNAGIPSLFETGASRNNTKLVTDCIVEAQPGDTLDDIRQKLHIERSAIEDVADSYGNSIGNRTVDVQSDGGKQLQTPQLQAFDRIYARHVEVQFCTSENNGQVPVQQ